MKLIYGCTLLLFALLLPACATTPPKKQANLCDIFTEKRAWYKHAKKAEKRWGSSVAVMMAIMQQESSFVANAKPPRKKILGFLPGPRLSSSYGYAQAQTATWREYQKASKRGGADRNDFDDAIDFIGWYNSRSKQRSRIAPSNAYALYLAYHEGHGGYNRGTYQKKAWLRKVARKVGAQATRYQQQLRTCERKLNKSRRWLF